MIRIVLVLLALGWASAAAAQDSIDGVTPATEARDSALAHAGVVTQSGGPYGDPRIGSYIAAIGERIRAVAGPDADKFQFTFTILDSPGVIAFAQPGGYIYLSRGLLALASNEAEIAAVVAHEMAHVLLRHGAYRQQLQRSMAGRTPGEIAGATNRLTRAQELQADERSVALLAAAGYDPNTQERFLLTVEAQIAFEIEVGMRGPRDGIIPEQPAIAERVARVRQAVAALGTDGTRDAWREGRSDHLAVIEGMVFGYRPSQGMITDTRYVDTITRISFDAPPGYRFRNIANLVAKNQIGATLRVDVQRARAETEMTDYLRAVVSPSTTFQTIESITIGGFKAAFAEATTSAARPESYVLAAVRLGTDRVMRFHFAQEEAFTAAEVEQIKGTLATFRRLTVQEAAAWQPMRLHVLTLGADATPETLAPQMDTPRGVDWLMHLNRLAPGARLHAGDLIKFVQE